MNAAQRRTTLRHLARAWPAGTVVTSPIFNGHARVIGISKLWAPGTILVLGIERNRQYAIQPKYLRRVQL